jgi:hypothetical protein
LDRRTNPHIEILACEHLRNDFSRRVEHAVEVRRSRTGAELVALDVAWSDLDEHQNYAGPFGPNQAAIDMASRIFDVWTHEQDIRCTPSADPAT